jgi:hypothetical protein
MGLLDDRFKYRDSNLIINAVLCLTIANVAAKGSKKQKKISAVLLLGQ